MTNRNKRNELEIICQILSLAVEETKKTHLMYQANLSYALLTRYLDLLLNKEFLGTKFGNPSGKVYFTTEKGKKFLEDVKKVLRQV